MQLKLFKIIILASIWAFSASAQTTLIPFRKGNLWGFSRPDKTIVVPCKYDEVFDFKNHKALVRKGLCYGLVDDTGKEIAPCQYYNEIVFSEGMAKVAKNRRKYKFQVSLYRASNQLYNYGFIDESGTEVIPCVYDMATNFHEGHAFVSKKGAYVRCGVRTRRGSRTVYTCKGSFIDTKGNLMGNFEIPMMGTFPQFENGYSSFQKNEKWGIVDTQYNVIVPFIYDEIFLNDDSTYTVKKNEKMGLISKTGVEMIPTIYEEMSYRRQGQVMSVKMSEKWGLLDNLGEMILPCEYDTEFNFSNGQSIICKNGKYGFVNDSGVITLPIIYDSATPFGKGMASVSLNGRRILIDSRMNQHTSRYQLCYGSYRYLRGVQDKFNNIIIPMDEYSQIEIIEDHFAILNKNNLFGLFDLHTQKWILPCTNQLIQQYRQDDLKTWLFLIYKNNLLGFVNSEGKLIADCTYDLDGNYPIFINEARQMVLVKKNKKFGYLDIKTGQMAISLSYDELFAFQNGKIGVHKDGKLGLIDDKEQILAPFEYNLYYNEDIFYTDGLAPLYRNGQLGFVDSSFRTVIPFEYDKTNSYTYFLNGLAPVAKKGKFGFVNRKNEPIVPLQYDNAHGFQEGRGCIHANYKTQFVDSTGNAVTDWLKGAASPYRNGVSILTIAHDTQVLINRNGEAISKKYRHISYLNDSVLLVETNLVGLMDLHGNELVPTQYQWITTYNELFYNALHDGKKGIILLKNKKFVPTDEPPLRIHDAYTIYRYDKKIISVGLIDSLGNTLFPITKNAYISAYGTYFLIGLNPKGVVSEGIMDASGKMLLPCMYFFPKPNVTDGYLLNSVKNKAGKMGIIHPQTLEWVIPCQYDTIRNFKNDLYQIENEGITYYASKNGIIYYEP